MITMKELENELTYCTGTTTYHYLNFLKNLKFTDGWALLAEKAECYWLSDIVASVQHIKKIKDNNDFLLWEIEVKDRKAVVTLKTDTDKPNLYIQKIGYTTFPEGKFGWYQCGDVVMLKSEY